MGVPARRVPDVATLLFAPLARGAQVSIDEHPVPSGLTAQATASWASAFLVLLLLFVWFTYRDLHQEVRRLRAGQADQLDDRAAAAGCSRTSRSAGCWSGRSASVDSDGEGATLSLAIYPARRPPDPGERDGADRAEDVVR